MFRTQTSRTKTHSQLCHISTNTINKVILTSCSELDVLMNFNLRMARYSLVTLNVPLNANEPTTDVGYTQLCQSLGSLVTVCSYTTSKTVLYLLLQEEPGRQRCGCCFRPGAVHSTWCEPMLKRCSLQNRTEVYLCKNYLSRWNICIYLPKCTDPFRHFAVFPPPSIFVQYVWLWLYCIVGTCEASRFDSNRTSRFNSKVTGRFENFESPRLPRLPSYRKQHSLFNDKFQSFWHRYWDLYWV